MSMLGAIAFILTLAGEATVVDGDTLKVQGQAVRLYGIDAPEKNQRCIDGDGERYLCGIRATSELKRLVRDRIVTCEGGKRDRYRRLIAVCRVAETDINGFLVRQGLAIAYRKYSNAYVAQERQAQADRLGLWTGSSCRRGIGAVVVRLAPGDD